MLDVMEFVWQFLQKKMLIKNPTFMSLKLIKTTQNCLIFLNLLSVLINKALIKKSKFILHFLDIFWNHSKVLAIFKIRHVVLINKSAYKKLK